MARAAFVASVEFAAPEIEESQRLLCIADFVAEIVGNPAVGIDSMEVRAEALGQKPGCDVEVLVVCFGEVLAPGASFFERGSLVGNAIAGGEGGPSEREEGSCSDSPSAVCSENATVPSGAKAFLILERSTE